MSRFPAMLAAGMAGASPRGKYLVGVSGGADSMALLGGLRELGFRNLVVCHFDHGLRPGQASKEAAMVRRASRGVDFARGTGDTQARAREAGFSIEAAARDLRYRFFSECAAARRCWKLILAHHAGDQVETVLLNLFRGTGLAGLGGMRTPARQGRLVVLRPMLTIPAAEPREYLRLRGIPFSEDPSNFSLAHTRNRIRRLAVPAILAAAGSGVPAAILRMAELARAEDEWLRELTPRLPAEPSVREVASLPLAAQRRAVRDWLRREGAPEAGFEETERTLSLLDKVAGPAKINLPGGWHARRRAGKLFLERPPLGT